MTILYPIRALVRWLFRRDEIERALDTDLADYIERSAAEKVRGGMTEAEARRAARIELGGVEQTKDSVRATRRQAHGRQNQPHQRSRAVG
jgi:hypothetical protein